MDIEKLHSVVMNKFVNKPYGHLLDYVGPIPTPEDCKICFPNVTGWWTPIENGAFFTGLYLYALLDNSEDVSKYRNDIDLFKNGMLMLYDISDKDCFVARGIGSDGKCHYPYSSDDQLGPFLVSMWKYRQSVLCTDSERNRIDERLMRIINAARSDNWCYCNEINDIPHGGCNDKWWRSVCQKLFMLRVAFEITGDTKWLVEYRNSLDEKPAGSCISRLRVIENGFSTYMIRQPQYAYYWIFTSSSLMHYELWSMENDGNVKEKMKRGLVRNGEIAYEFTRDFEIKPERQYDLEFDSDWRKLKDSWKPLSEQGNPIAFASEQCRVWESQVPARRYEHTNLANSIFSAWICMKCTDIEIADAAFANLCENIEFTDWDKLHLCYAFAAESAYISHK